MLAGGEIGRSAVLGREDGWVYVGAVGDGTACWITAGAGGGGSVGVPASVSAGVISSWFHD